MSNTAQHGSVATKGARSASRRSPLQWIIQIFGELLITVGLILLLFVAWQLWWTNIAANSAQDDAVQSLSQEFKDAAGSSADAATDGVGNGAESSDGTSGENADSSAQNTDASNPPVAAGAPGEGEAYGIVYIPRLGENYQRPIAEGTSTEVLDTLGLGHYEDTAEPGEIGNFSLAGHRQTNGAVLDNIDQLQEGDKIYVRTREGYYTYSVYKHEIVLPTQVEVIAPNPDNPGAAPTERIMTLTSCHPRYGDTERYIVHAKMESFQPQSAGAPVEIAGAVN